MWGHLALELTCPCARLSQASHGARVGLPLPWREPDPLPHVGSGSDRVHLHVGPRHVHAQPTSVLDATASNAKLDMDASTPNLMLGLDSIATNSMLDLYASMPNPTLGLDTTAPNHMLDLDASTLNPMLGLDRTAPNHILDLDVSTLYPMLALDAFTPNPTSVFLI
jgi:hypothetical protein